MPQLRDLNRDCRILYARIFDFALCACADDRQQQPVAERKNQTHEKYDLDAAYQNAGAF